jgi:hypothetical protein
MTLQTLVRDIINTGCLTRYASRDFLPGCHQSPTFLSICSMACIITVRTPTSIATRNLLLPAGRSNAEQLHLSWNRTSTLQMYALLLSCRTQKAYSMHLVYVNSYMALLNARHYLGSDGSPHSIRKFTHYLTHFLATCRKIWLLFSLVCTCLLVP